MYVGATCGKSIIDVFEEPVPPNTEEPNTQEKLYRVFLNARDLGLIRLQAWQPPRVCLGSSHVAVWGGRSVFYAQNDGGGFEESHFQPDVAAVFQIPRAWCIVTELAVILADLKTMNELGRIESDDVILRFWWENDTLVIEDFNKIIMRIAVDQKTLQLDRLK